MYYIPRVLLTNVVKTNESAGSVSLNRSTSKTHCIYGL